MRAACCDRDIGNIEEVGKPWKMSLETEKGPDPEVLTATIVSHVSQLQHITGTGERSKGFGDGIEGWDKYIIDMYLSKEDIKLRYWQCV